MNKPIKKVGIRAFDNYPDFEYVIDRLIDLAEKQNEVIERVNQLEDNKGKR